MNSSTITREQLLKEAPRLVEYAIMRGWMSYPKKVKQPSPWNDLTDEEDIQELRKTITQGPGDR
jgi:hypothetical protein